MFSSDLITEQPFATKIFSAAIKSNKLAHAYMFTQAQAIVQYKFALSLAKILNCSNKIDDEPCNICTNCKWINNNTHPAVITISPVDFIPQKEDDSIKDTSRSKNEVKVGQAALLQKELMSISKYFRVIIFMGAKDEKLPEEKVDSLWLGYKNKVMPPSNAEGRDLWVPMYLNHQSFPSKTANILLKSVEEPASNVLFIFITKDSDDMLSTIVSRCQVLPLLRVKDLEVVPVEYLNQIKALLPPQNELDSFSIAKNLLNLSKSDGIAIENLIEYVEMIYHDKLKQSCEEGTFSNILVENIKKIEESKSMIKSYVNPQAALVTMLNSLIVK